MTGNILRSVLCRYITGQDDDRDPTMKLQSARSFFTMITAYV